MQVYKNEYPRIMNVEKNSQKSFLSFGRFFGGRVPKLNSYANIPCCFTVVHSFCAMLAAGPCHDFFISHRLAFATSIQNCRSNP